MVSTEIYSENLDCTTCTHSLLPGVVDGKSSTGGGRRVRAVGSTLPGNGSARTLAEELVLEGSVGRDGDGNEPNWVRVGVGQGTDRARSRPVGEGVDAAGEVDVLCE